MSRINRSDKVVDNDDAPDIDLEQRTDQNGYDITYYKSRPFNTRVLNYESKNSRDPWCTPMTTHGVLLRPTIRDTMAARRAIWELLESQTSDLSDPVDIEVPSFEAKILPQIDTIPVGTYLRRDRSVRRFSRMGKESAFPSQQQSAIAPVPAADIVNNDLVHLNSLHRSDHERPTEEHQRSETSMRNLEHSTITYAPSKRQQANGASVSKTEVKAMSSHPGCARKYTPSNKRVSSNMRLYHPQTGKQGDVDKRQEGSGSKVPPPATAPAIPVNIRELPPDSRLNELTTSQKARAKASLERRMSLEFSSTVNTSKHRRPSSASPSVADANYMRATVSRRASLGLVQSSECIEFNSNATADKVSSNVNGLILRGHVVPANVDLERLSRFDQRQLE